MILLKIQEIKIKCQINNSNLILSLIKQLQTFRNMLKQEAPLNYRKVHVQIPQTKRYNFHNHSVTNPITISTSLSHQSPFQSLIIQLQDLKNQLGLRSSKSGFIKVCSIDEDCRENFKHQNTRAPFFTEDSEHYKASLHNLVELIQKADHQSQKQRKQFIINTKNILRNVCNAQNQYILFNSSAQKIIDCHLSNDQKFKVWVNKLRFHTFEQFQQTWTFNKRSVFSKLYKKLCRKFYIENAIPYIMNSRIKNRNTKVAHIRYMYRFLQGLDNPQQFCYFKQKEKEKGWLKDNISEH